MQPRITESMSPLAERYSQVPAKGANLIHCNNSPESFTAWLQRAKDYADDYPDQTKLIALFSWNEWVEGGYLLPDMRWKYGYPEAVKKVIKD